MDGTKHKTRPCHPCIWTYAEDAAYAICDHTEVEVRLAYALGHWVTDDPEDDDVLSRAAMFLNSENEDVRRILAHVPHDDASDFTVEAQPEFDTEGGQGFAVNGVGFAIEYQQEGEGLVQPAATWRPECEWCDQPVLLFGDTRCPECMAIDAAEEANEKALRG